MSSPNESNSSTSAEVLPEVVASDKSNVNGYDEFMSWRRTRNINSFAEEVFIEFFREVGETHTPESLYILFSTLKATMRSELNVHIGRFISLIALLREKGVVIKRSCSSSKGFSEAEINAFLTEAPDDEYLAIKAAAVIGIYADCRLTDLRRFRLNMVNDYGTEVIVRIPDRRTGKSKVYAISGEFADIVRKYLQLRLRPRKIKTDRFFLQYRKGKCSNTAMGLVTLSKIARKIAEFLQLDHPENYTGFSFQITSSKLADKGLYAGTTEGSCSIAATCNPAGLVATSSNVVLNGASNSADDCCMGLSQVAGDYDLSDTCVAIYLDTDDESSPAYTVESSSEDDQDVVENTDQNGQANCLRDQRQPDSDIEFVDLSSEPNENVHHAGDILAETAPTASDRMLQCKIEQQAKEIVRLKQLNQKQSLEIEILKDLLEKSIKEGIRNAM